MWLPGSSPKSAARRRIRAARFGIAGRQVQELVHELAACAGRTERQSSLGLAEPAGNRRGRCIASLQQRGSQ